MPSSRIGLDHVRTAVDNTRATAAGIADICAAAGQPERAGELIRSGATVDQVRRLLSGPAAGQLPAPAASNAMWRGSFDPSVIPSRFDTPAIERKIAFSATTDASPRLDPAAIPSRLDGAAVI